MEVVVFKLFNDKIVKGDKKNIFFLHEIYDERN